MVLTRICNQYFQCTRKFMIFHCVARKLIEIWTVLNYATFFPSHLNVFFFTFVIFFFLMYIHFNEKYVDEINLGAHFKYS